MNTTFRLGFFRPGSRCGLVAAICVLALAACGGGHDGDPDGGTPPPAVTAPTVTVQPAASTITAGGSATFSATVAGDPSPTLVWQLVGGATLADGAGSGPLAGATISGAATATLTLSAVPASADGLQLRLHASNSAGSVDSRAATLTVNAASIGTLIAAAAGGRVTTPDGRFTLTFPAGAFTADTTVTMSAATAPTLPTVANWRAIAPRAGSYTQIAFTGGQLKAGATFTARARAGASAKASAERRSIGDRGGSGITVLQCADGTQAYYGALDADGYGSTVVGCDGAAQTHCTIGLGDPVDMRDSAPLATVATTLVGDEGRLAVGNGYNGRVPAYFESNVPGVGLAGHLVIAGGAATLEEFDLGRGVVLAVDDTGLALRADDACTVSAYGAVIGTGGVATMQKLATSPPLLQPGQTCPAQYDAATGVTGFTAVWRGNGWLVHASFGTGQPALYWLSPAAAVTTQSAYAYAGPGGESAPDTVHDLAADAAGNAWIAVSRNDNVGVACGRFSDFNAHPCLSLIHAAPGLAAPLQMEIGHLKLSDQRATASLAMDASGAAYLSTQPMVSSNYSRLTVRKFNADGSPGWQALITDAWFLKPGGLVLGGAGKLYAYGDGSTEDANGVDTFGAFVYRLDPTAGTVEAGTHWGGDNAVANDNSTGLRSARLFSADASGNLTVIGRYVGTMDGVGSGSRYGNSSETPNSGYAIYVRRFSMTN